MTGTLKESIAAANQRAGKERQKVFAKKAYLQQTDAQIIEMLCGHVERLIVAGKTWPDKTVFPALSQAVTIARRHLEKKR